MDYCMGCVPLRPGVWAIAILQAMYSGVRVYLASGVSEPGRDFGFYLDYTGHWLGLAAAVFLALGIIFERPQLLLPWVGLTLLLPATFLASLVSNLIFFNLAGAWGLLVREGIPMLATTYILQVVYSLYCQMGGQGSDHPDTESAQSQLDTFYGTSNLVFLNENSGSVLGQVTPSLQDAPPAYESLVSATKDHVEA